MGFNEKPSTIVDGHLCLINDQNEVERISCEIFLEMDIECIYLVVDTPRHIQQHSFMEKKNIILPIKPLFVEKVLSGEKKYEYRKKLCQKEIDKIYLYSTSPVKMIVGEAEVVDKMRMDKDLLWAKTRRQALQRNSMINISQDKIMHVHTRLEM